MIPRYRVYRGPGNRLVAISQEPVDDHWIIKSGEEGKRLRSSTVPTSIHAGIKSVESDHVPDGYQLLHTGKIDAYGRSIDHTVPLIHWEARSVDVQVGRELLREYALDLKARGVAISVTDDMSGTCVTFDQIKFGLTRAPTPGCITSDGNGAGSLSPVMSADLLCLIALLSRSISISLANAEGNPLTRGAVMGLCGSYNSDAMSDFLREHGVSSLSASLRNLNNRQVCF